MQAVELTLLSYNYSRDDIGQEIKTPIEQIIPIKKITSIVHEEFYAANEQNLKPEAKFIISSLNYNGETDLKYMDTPYTVIRTTSTNVDEITLICEKRIGDIGEDS